MTLINKVKEVLYHISNSKERIEMVCDKKENLWMNTIQTFTYSESLLSFNGLNLQVASDTILN